MSKWVRFTKRTEDPKLRWIEKQLDSAGIKHRRNGDSAHAPILEIEDKPKAVKAAYALLDMPIHGKGRLDDIPDDDPMFELDLEENSKVVTIFDFGPDHWHEVGRMVFEGEEYESGGACLCNGRLIAYVAKSDTGEWMLTTWGGQTLARHGKLKKRWPTPKSYMSTEMFQSEFTVNGKVYTGRTAGVGMVYSGKLKKGQKASEAVVAVRSQ